MLSDEVSSIRHLFVMHFQTHPVVADYLLQKL